jgi:uncharacterized protein (TIGR02246 family)
MTEPTQCPTTSVYDYSDKSVPQAGYAAIAYGVIALVTGLLALLQYFLYHRPGTAGFISHDFVAQEWADLAVAGKDIDKVVSYWSDDAVVIFPGQPVIEGKAAIRAYVTNCFQTPGFKIHWVSKNPTFSADGKLAYMFGTDEATVPGLNGEPMTLHSRGISIWRLESDGQWHCVADVSSEEPSATPKL